MTKLEHGVGWTKIFWLDGDRPTEQDKAALAAALDATPAQSGAARPVAWQCTDDRYPYIKGMVTDRQCTADAWREGGIKFVELGPLTPAAWEAPHADDLAQFLRDVEREQGNCDDDDTYLGYRATAEAILQKFDVRPK